MALNPVYDEIEELILEEAGDIIGEVIINPAHTTITLTNSYGEDVIMLDEETFQDDGTGKDLSRLLNSRASNFDLDEYVRLMLNCPGAPDAAGLVEAGKENETNYKRIAAIVEKFVTQR